MDDATLRARLLALAHRAPSDALERAAVDLVATVVLPEDGGPVAVSRRYLGELVRVLEERGC